jgi:predicted alpha/beta-hydrolase family hydrolase
VIAPEPVPSSAVPLDGAGATEALHYAPDEPAGTLLVLAHGAGAGQRHPFMQAMAAALAARGIDVVTFDFPYMQAGRRLPDKAPVLEACFAAVAAAARVALPAGHRLFIGGKSMGGRIASQIAAAHAVPGLIGLIALGYPLHPPGKPDQLRTAHLPGITVPMLIVQGERDAFGRPDELRPVLASMPAEVKLVVVPDGDHSFAAKKTPAAAVRASIADALALWMAQGAS